MAAIDDAIYKYLCENPGGIAYEDSGSTRNHAIRQGSGSHSRPAWVEDADISDRWVIDFDQTSDTNGRAADYQKLLVGSRWGFGAGDFSVAFWIKPTSSSDGTIVSEAGYRSGYTAQGWLLSLSTNQLRGEFSNGTEDSSLSSSVTLTDDEWAACVLTYDFSEAKPRFYLDGSESTYLSGAGPADVAGDLTSGGDVLTTGTTPELAFNFIGVEGYGNDHYSTYNLLATRLVGPCFWDRILTGSEITELVTIPAIPTSGGSSNIIVVED